MLYACIFFMHTLEAQQMAAFRTENSTAALFQHTGVAKDINQGLPDRWFDKPIVKDGLVPGLLIGDGLATYDHHKFLFSSAGLKGEIVEDYPHFHTSVDNYLQYVPAVETFTLRFTHLQPAHDIKHQLALFFTTTLIQGIVVTSLKYAVHEQRPDGSDFHSFPSGHTTTAFGGAMFLYEEYKNSPHHWVAYTGFPVAATTAALRLYNNRHWYSDVAVGAALGILCTEASYAILPDIDRWFHWKHPAPDVAKENLPWLFLSKQGR
ncbi:PAP2 superfamily protein [Thermoflavifilum thermophilum]|uniref:PAP2 superfamily protein n=2 Tax=Thermoflavifilum thermophilum TaxID=1393122 RepID=A0A1I7NJZ4_9BACT|nr:PAP2 superfamily protein [Thermoflavifilum thermophilum]